MLRARIEQKIYLDSSPTTSIAFIEVLSLPLKLLESEECLSLLDPSRL